MSRAAQRRARRGGLLVVGIMALGGVALDGSERPDGTATTVIAAGSSQPAFDMGLVVPDPVRHVHGDGTVHLHAATPGALPSACRGLDALVDPQGEFLGCTHGEDEPIGRPVPVAPLPDAPDTGRTASAGAASPGSSVVPGPTTMPCEPGDDGQGGRRIQLLFVREAASTETLASVEPTIRSVLAQMHTTLMLSAQKTGGRRHLRFAHDGSCVPSVIEAVVPTGSLTDFTTSTAALRSLGYDADDRKYLSFVDSDVYCGIAGLFVDDSQDGFAHQEFGQHSRVDRRCWSYGEVALHEVMHNLGAVQPTAPNATDGFHCTDDFDVLCYDDGTLQAGRSMVMVCPRVVGKELLDCGDDDYFSTAPPPGSYLATRWNTARSAFLFQMPRAEVPLGIVDSMWYAAGAVSERPSVLTNDINPSPAEVTGPMTAELVSQPARAVVDVAADGTFTVTSSDPSLEGYDLFFYRPVIAGWGHPVAVYLWPTSPLSAPTAAPNVTLVDGVPTVSWTYPANASAVGAELAMSSDGTTWTTVSTGLGPQSWADTAAQPGVTRSYRFRGVGRVPSAWSPVAELRVNTPRGPAPDAGGDPPRPEPPGRSPAPAAEPVTSLPGRSPVP